MNIYEKLQSARDFIRNKKVSKDGKNSFCHYSYFTPEHIESIVNKVSKKFKIICLTSLKQDDNGYFQEMKIYDLEEIKADPLLFELRTKHGVVTATNDTQQMGSTDTYSDRYIKMKAFCIKDGSLDPDFMNGKAIEKETKPYYNNFEKHKNAMEQAMKGGEATCDSIIEKLSKTYRISEKVKEQIKAIK